MKVQWSERPSGAHHSQHLVSGRQLQNVKLVVYSTTVPATLLLLYNIYSETWVTLQIEIIACWLAVTSDMRSIRYVVGGTQWEDVASHFEIDNKKKQKNTDADNRKHFDIDQCVLRSVPNNQDDSWSMLPESEVYKHIIKLLHLYNLKQTSASALQRVMDNFY